LRVDELPIIMRILWWSLFLYDCHFKWV